MRNAALVGHREGGPRAAFCSGMYCKGVKRHAKYQCRIGGEMVEKERIRELLEKQLELLSEQSRGDPAMLPQLTDSMVQVVSLLRSL